MLDQGPAVRSNGAAASPPVTGRRPRSPRAPPPSTAATPDSPIPSISSAPMSTASLPLMRPDVAPAPSPAVVRPPRPPRLCAACGLPVTHQFVRALGGAYHLACFKCVDCDQPVTKFFPLAAPDGTQHPLCERDYFARLDLLCAYCGGALRGAYISALGRKYHADHFMCSQCDVVFGPAESYYEHQGAVFCLYHFSTGPAARCSGCHGAILRQFVEVARQGAPEQWHPECYMVHKAWNVSVAGTGPPTDWPMNPTALDRDRLRAEQQRTEDMVARLLSVLGVFEESAAACISDMLLHVSNGRNLDGVNEAASFILHVEVLFRAIDWIQAQLADARAPNPVIHRKEPKLLCKRIVAFLSLLTKTHDLAAPTVANSDAGSVVVAEPTRRLAMTQDLLNIVTTLAHTLKALTRVALCGALRLENECHRPNSVLEFLDILMELSDQERPARMVQFEDTHLKADLCHACRKTIEEACIAVLARARWHVPCFTCSRCRMPLGTVHDLPHATWSPTVGGVVCLACSNLRSPPEEPTFQLVTNLDQNSLLLRVALKRLLAFLNHAFLKKSGKFYFRYVAAFSNGRNLGGVNEHWLLILHVEVLFLAIDWILEQLADVRAPNPVTHRKEPKMLRKRIVAFLSLLDKTHDLAAPTVANSDAGSAMPAATATPIRLAPVAPPPSSTAPELWLAEQSALEAFVVRHFAANDLVLLLHGRIRADEIIALTEERQAAARSLLDSSGGIWDRFRATFRGPGRRRDREAAAAQAAAEAVAQAAARMIAATPTAAVTHSEVELETNGVGQDSGHETGDGVVVSGGSVSMEGAGTFGVPLDVLLFQTGRASTLGAGPGRVAVPAFIDMCVGALRAKDLYVEGIFRLNGNVRGLRELTEELDARPLGALALLPNQTVVQLAALLRKFLRELPEPLIPFRMFKLFMQIGALTDPNTRARAIHDAVCLLPKAHRNVLEVVLLCVQEVAKACTHPTDPDRGSRMTEDNLAIIFAPTLFRPPKGIDETVTSKAAKRIVLDMLNWPPRDLWTVPPEIALQLRHGGHAATASTTASASTVPTAMSDASMSPTTAEHASPALAPHLLPHQPPVQLGSSRVTTPADPADPRRANARPAGAPGHRSPWNLPPPIATPSPPVGRSMAPSSLSGSASGSGAVAGGGVRLVVPLARAASAQGAHGATGLVRANEVHGWRAPA
ncbi:hypothetical protein AMAG_06226 [Allomyces macrogynus ATCC 38327]|uniref:RhoGAP-domain-containing protein n=1 Tax=Allomyces macrogynus (strain ATCC 38327) TaxID=578462 RepID=A0A0L0SFX1_ALLM3|nr:hypothetical protein AMAG_06226 [Allomyces macrogynus ATCC 38327]|eukprot:KNE61396.1 hypothetical protein AMAG_06226 [Allomyces macrogynus ATCC 38327]